MKRSQKQIKLITIIANKIIETKAQSIKINLFKIINHNSKTIPINKTIRAKIRQFKFSRLLFKIKV
jgi:hypothetical protein